MRSEDQVDKGIALFDLLHNMLFLHHAAAETDDHISLFLLDAVQMTETAVDVLVCIFTDCTGVVNDKVRLVLIVRILKAGCGENSPDLFGIAGVHLTPERRHIGLERPSERLLEFKDIRACLRDELRLALRFGTLFFYTFQTGLHKTSILFAVPHILQIIDPVKFLPRVIHKDRPDVLSLDDPVNDAEIIRIRDHHIRACRGGDLRGDQLCRHSPCAETASCGSFGHFHEMTVQMIHFRNKDRVRIFVGIVRVEPVDIGEEQEKICLDQSCDDGRKTVVVSEFDIVGSDRVVLVHDRDDSHLKELIKGIPGVHTALSVCDSLLGHEDLGSRLAVLGEEFLIDHHEADLPDRRAGLLFLQ